MQFVEDDRVEIAEEIGRVGMAQEQRDLFGRRQQDLWRADALALAARHRCIAGARLGPDLEAHLIDRLQ